MRTIAQYKRSARRTLRNDLQLHAAAIDFRDQRAQSMNPADWQQVESLLQQSFSDLSTAVRPPD